MQITSTSSLQLGLNAVSGVMTYCSNGNNYVLDNSAIHQYDQNWNYIGDIFWNQALTLISVLENNTRIYFISCNNGLYKLDSNFSIINAYVDSQWSYRYNSRLCFNTAINHLIATSSKGLVIFDYFLTLIKYFELQATDIEEYNGTVYVSTPTGVVWILINEMITSSFNTTCSSIKSLLIDPFGYIAVLCTSNEIHVYSSNGTFTSNVSMTNLLLNPIDMGFDSKGNLVITDLNGVYIINTPQNTPKVTVNATLDNSCINKSIL